MSYANYQSRRLPWVVRYVSDLLRYRHLCWNLVASNLRARFRRSSLGLLWAVLQPLGYALVIAWAWAAVLRADSYWEFAVYVFSGMLVWEAVSNTLTASLDGLGSSVGYLRQGRIPLLVFQVRAPLTSMVVLMAGLVGLLAFMVALQKIPPIGQHLLLVPAFLLVLPMFIIPLAIVFSLLGALFRDLGHITTLGLQALFFLSPVMLDREIMNEPHLAVLKYGNPMVPLLDLFRGPLLYGKFWDPTEVITLAVWIVSLWTAAIIVSVQQGRRIVFAL